MSSGFGRIATLAVIVTLSSCTCGRQPPPKQVLKDVGEPCSTDDSCKTGLCDGLPGAQATCVVKCADGCAADEICTQLTPNRFACQPDARKLCQACQVDADCPYPADKCLVVNGENVCGRDCAFDQTCPQGYRCVNGLGTDGQPKIQQCTPQDASCACLARGDFLQPCEVKNAFGTCTGVKQCDLVSNDVVCDAPTPAEETCNGLDDDCDGTADDGLPTQACGVGACAVTVSSCSADGGTVDCVPGTPTTELCNQVDDDCDGTVDNGFQKDSDVHNCGSCGNECALPSASPMCVAGTCRVASCVSPYGDCNNTDSDGCEAPLDSDVNNCGACGNKCTQQNATASCVSGGCQFACAPGYYDLDKDPSNGCEYACTFTSATDVPDLLFVDANCDGIDGELNNGVFVSPQGNDSNPGTRAQPVATLGTAASLLVTAGKRDLYLAAGTYSGGLELLGSSGVNVAGGYDPNTWARSVTPGTVLSGGNPALKIESGANLLVQMVKLQGGNASSPGASAYGAFVKDSTSVSFESLNIVAGNGAPGASGAQGSPGATGGAGSTGPGGCTGTADVGCAIEFDYCNSRPGAGQGGASACGYPGGNGGQPSYGYGAPLGDPGLAAPNGTGAGGQGVPGGKAEGPAGAPYNGVAGQAGAAGTLGTSANAPGSFGPNGFVPANGTSGTAGTSGRGGGGGGGGGGDQGYSFVSGVYCQAWGSGGGGGGGGGCGGAGGAGGGGGGASVGLFLSNAQVSAKNVVVQTGNGGAGGAGGQGGQGGVGGAGGGSSYDGQGNASVGGLGGAGGSGGGGGSGGAGAGGSVYGLAKNAGSTWNPISGTAFNLGTPGAGGSSPAGPGAAGTSGIQLNY